MKEKRLRSIVKTATWRIIATAITSLLVLTFTHQWTLALTIGGLEGILKLLFYYLHERVWDGISWGKRHHAHK
jgi:uncharacterized membrane protein